MKWLIIILLACGLNSLHAQPQAFFDHKIFYTPSGEPYLETYFNFLGESLKAKAMGDSSYCAELSLTLILSKDTNIVDYSKLNIKSPLVKDSVISDFIDLQRFKLAAGDYNISIEIKDLNASRNTTTKFDQKIFIEKAANKAYLSDIMLVGDAMPSNKKTMFTKSGIEMLPYVSNFYFDDLDKILFYTEIYNSKLQFPDSGARFVIAQKILNPSNGQVFRDYVKYTRLTPNEVIPHFSDFDLSQLPSGNFELAVELRDAKNELVVSKKIPFSRSNQSAEFSMEEVSDVLLENSFVKGIAIDTIQEYIFCLRPIANETDKKIIDEQKRSLTSLEEKKRFFYAFWARKNATDPAFAWYSYRQEVLKVNQMFKTQIKKGYETDRGRVYLQYGPPNTRTERPNETANYPYEIWHYYNIGKYNNRRFVFYNSDLITNDFELLHSDMFGEPKNQNWRVILARRNNPTNNFENRTPQPQFGNSSDDFYNNPR